jgi:D-alanyl-D-alanine carboxypeptidase
MRLIDAGGVDRSGEITLRMLLKHTGGLPHQPPADFDPAKFDSSWEDEGLFSKLTRAWTLTLVAAPGAYAYSNLGYVLLAAVLEQLERNTFARAMEPFLRRFGMAESTFWPSGLEASAAWGHVPGNGPHAPGWYTSRYGLPFSGLWTTTGDLVAFARALKQAALREMTLATAPGHGLGPVIRDRNGALALEHDGSGPGFLAWFLFIPRDELVIAVVTNGGGEQRAPALRLRAIIDTLVTDELASRAAR